MSTSYTDNMCVGIVCGGDDNDPAPDHSGNMKVFLPGSHGEGVKLEHLAFSTMMKPATNSGQQTFEGCLDPGSIVFCRKDTGSNQVHIMGTGNEIFRETSVADNSNILKRIPALRKILKQTINVNIPPTIQESMEGGKKIRKIQEKGQLHNHSLLQGLPANGAIYSIAGSIVPQIKNVATASTQFNQILTPAIASLLPGLSVPLGGLLSSLASGNLVGALAGKLIDSVTSELADQLPGEIVGAVGAAATQMITPEIMRDLSRQLQSKLSPDMQTTFKNMSLLTSSIETGVGGGFTSGSKVDPMTFAMNAVDLISQCNSIGDMVSCMQQLQYDQSLTGQDKLPNITMMVDTPFGIKMPLSISASGAISQNIPEPLKKAVEAFSSLMSSASGFPGVNPGENLFGKSAKDMFNMLQRLDPKAQKAAIELGKALNQSDIAQTLDKAVKATVTGENVYQVLFSKG